VRPVTLTKEPTTLSLRYFDYQSLYRSEPLLSWFSTFNFLDLKAPMMILMGAYHYKMFNFKTIDEVKKHLLILLAIWDAPKTFTGAG